MKKRKGVTSPFLQSCSSDLVRDSLQRKELELSGRPSVLYAKGPGFKPGQDLLIG